MNESKKHLLFFLIFLCGTFLCTLIENYFSVGVLIIASIVSGVNFGRSLI